MSGIKFYKVDAKLTKSQSLANAQQELPID